MALGGIDLNLLVILQALLEEGNVTRAGARLGLPQPAMSNALARLRRHYRDELLLRIGNGYDLTPLARSLLPSVQESARLIGHRSPSDTSVSPRLATACLPLAFPTTRWRCLASCCCAGCTISRRTRAFRCGSPPRKERTATAGCSDMTC